MTFLELIIVMIVNLLSFTIGAIIGQKVVKKEPIEINPIKALQQEVAIKESNRLIEEEKRKFDVEMANIDAYDGTSVGQQDLPR